MLKNRFKTKDIICDVIRVLFIFNLFVTYILSAFYTVLCIDNSTLNIVTDVVYILSFAIYLFLRPRKKPVPILVMFLFLLLIFVAYSSMIEKEFDKSGFLTCLCLSLPSLLMFSDRIESGTYKVLGVVSIVSGLFFTVLFTVQAFVLKVSEKVDYQSVSYALIIPILFLIQKKKNILDFVLLFIMFFFAVFMGGRGPLICVLLFFVYHTVFGVRKVSFIKIAVLIGMVFIIINLEELLSFIVQTTEKYNLGGSFAIYLKYGNMFSDSGRNDLYLFCIEEANKKWLLGYGLFSDRLLLVQVERSYPHNLFVELALQFGYPIACLVLLFILFNAFKYLFLFKTNDYRKNFFDVLFFSTGFMILMFSSSYLIQPQFFALIGLFLNRHKEFKLASASELVR